MKNRFDEFSEMRLEFITPRAEMNAGENDFFCATIERELNILDHVSDGSAPRFAARDGGNAKRALIVAM